MPNYMQRTKVIPVQISQGETVSGRNTISSIIPTATVALVTTAQAHGYLKDNTVRVSGCTGADAVLYNGKFKVLTVPSATTFTYDTGQTPAGSAAGSPIADKDEDVNGHVLAAIGLPAAFTGTSLTFLGDIDGSDSYLGLRESDVAGAAVSLVVGAANTIIQLSSSEVLISGLVGLKVVSSGAEAAARTVKLSLIRAND